MMKVLFVRCQDLEHYDSRRKATFKWLVFTTCYKQHFGYLPYKTKFCAVSNFAVVGRCSVPARLPFGVGAFRRCGAFFVCRLCFKLLDKTPKSIVLLCKAPSFNFGSFVTHILPCSHLQDRAL